MCKPHTHISSSEDVFYAFDSSIFYFQCLFQNICTNYFKFQDSQTHKTYTDLSIFCCIYFFFGSSFETNLIFKHNTIIYDTTLQEKGVNLFDVQIFFLNFNNETFILLAIFIYPLGSRTFYPD